VLSGKLAELKRRFGKQNLHMEYEGSVEFLKKSKAVKKIDQFGNTVELQLAKDADTQELLKEAVKSCRISRFEIKEPSLNDIFIDSVTQSENGGRSS